LVSVDAPAETRFRRMFERNRGSDPKTWEDFLITDARDKGEGELETGQGVGKCMMQADFTLINSGALEEVQEKIEKLYEEIERKIPRPTWDEYFTEISKSVAKRATCNRGIRGCVITKDKHILVTGYIGSPRGAPHCDEIGHQIKTVIHEDGTKSQHCARTIHAEQNAICQAAKLGIALESSILYCEMTPCSVCAKMIINAGIKRVVCEKKHLQGAESEELFRQAGVKLGLLSDETETYKDI